MCIRSLDKSFRAAYFGISIECWQVQSIVRKKSSIGQAKLHNLCDILLCKGISRVPCTLLIVWMAGMGKCAFSSVDNHYTDHDQVIAFSRDWIQAVQCNDAKSSIQDPGYYNYHFSRCHQEGSLCTCLRENQKRQKINLGIHNPRFHKLSSKWSEGRSAEVGWRCWCFDTSTWLHCNCFNLSNICQCFFANFSIVLWGSAFRALKCAQSMTTRAFFLANLTTLPGECVETRTNSLGLMFVAQGSWLSKDSLRWT
jgi:hypothetical protein